LGASIRKLTALEAVAPFGVTVTEALRGLRYHTGTAAAERLIENADAAGTLTTTEVLVQDDAFATTGPNFTAPVRPKPLPRIVTHVPTTP
jgi:hypothetical protein